MERETYRVTLAYTYDVVTDDIERTMRLLIDPRFPDVDASLDATEVKRKVSKKLLDK